MENSKEIESDNSIEHQNESSQANSEDEVYNFPISSPDIRSIDTWDSRSRKRSIKKYKRYNCDIFNERKADKYGFIVESAEIIQVDAKYYIPGSISIITEKNIRSKKFDSFIFEGIPLNLKRIFWNLMVNKNTKKDFFEREKVKKDIFCCCFSSDSSKKLETKSFYYDFNEESNLNENFLERKKMDFTKSDKIEKLKINNLEFESSVALKQIHADIQRTLRHHCLFYDKFGFGQTMLYNVLHKFSEEMPEIGYCQGLSCISGVLLIYMPEKEAYSILKNFIILNNIQFLFDKSLSHLKPILFAQEKILKKLIPKIFDKIKISLKNIMTKWYLTLFSRFPIEIVLRIWDLMFYFGFPVLLIVTATILKLKCKEIGEMKKDEFLMFLGSLEKSEYSTEEFISCIKKFYDVIKPKQIQKIIDEEINLIEKKEY